MPDYVGVAPVNVRCGCRIAGKLIGELDGILSDKIKTREDSHLAGEFVVESANIVGFKVVERCIEAEAACIDTVAAG
jgi:hypothetical protein